MKLKDLLAKIYSSPEKDVLELTVKHANICRETVRQLNIVLANLLKKSKTIPEDIAKVSKLEEDADAIRRQLLDLLAKGAMPPISRVDFMRLAERVDMTADWAKEAARVITIIQDLPAKRFYVNYLEMIEHIVKGMQLLSKAIDSLGSNFEEIMPLVKEIETIEDKVDELYVVTLKKIVEEEELRTEILYVKLLESLEMIMDSCEDASDVLEEITIRALR